MHEEFRTKNFGPEARERPVVYARLAERDIIDARDNFYVLRNVRRPTSTTFVRINQTGLAALRKAEDR